MATRPEAEPPDSQWELESPEQREPIVRVLPVSLARQALPEQVNEARQACLDAIHQRREFGLLGADPVPRVPGT